MPTPTPALTEPTPTPTTEPEDEIDAGAEDKEVEEADAEDTVIPVPSYTLNIPADQSVMYKAESHVLGCPTVYSTSGFTAGKNIKLSITWTAFISETTLTQIPFTMSMVSTNGKTYSFTSGTVYFIGNENGTASEYPIAISKNTGEHIPASYFLINFNASDWNKAHTGEYKAGITFSTEILE